MDEFFWTKKQSCKFSKVDIKNWRPFFDFVCFNGCHILKLRYLRRDSMEFQNFLFSVLSLTYIFIIYHALLCSNLQGYDHVSGHLSDTGTGDTTDLCNFVINELNSTSEVHNMGNGAFQNAPF